MSLTSTHTSHPAAVDVPALSFSGVTRSFGGRLALDRTDIDVRRGEFVSIVGPSGCGKSTVLRIGSGLDEATDGSVTRASSRIGYVFQDATLMPWLSVRKNVELLGSLARLGKAELRSRVDESLALVGLSDFADSLPTQLSGGMRMRASLARTLVLDPEIFLFDEPFGALDEITRGRLNLELTQLFLQRNFGALFVTHSVEEAVFLSSRVLVMSPRPGRIIAEYDVPFAFPRPPELRYDSAFATLSGQVAASLEHAA